MYNREREIREAIEAGERALSALKEAKNKLGSARGWGLLDLFGGGTITGLIKHVRIDDAKNKLDQAKRELDRFSRELRDVRDLQGLNLEIGSFLTFADFFFDGFLADVMVQRKIRQMQDSLDEAIRRVEKLVEGLKMALR